MSRLSGHKAYSYIMNAPKKDINGNEYVFFDPVITSKRILEYINDTTTYK